MMVSVPESEWEPSPDSWTEDSPVSGLHRELFNLEDPFSANQENVCSAVCLRIHSFQSINISLSF